MKLLKKTGRNTLTHQEAFSVLEDFFIGDNLYYAKSLFIEWHDFGLSASGSLRMVFMEIL